MTYSPDVLAANPELAAAVKKTKAKTPSGKGRGFTDDAQRYPRRKVVAADLYRQNVAAAYCVLHNPPLLAELARTHPEAHGRLVEVLEGLRKVREELG